MTTAPPASTPQAPEGLSGLSGYRLALVGFDPSEAAEIGTVLAGVKCGCEMLTAEEGVPGGPMVEACACTLVNLSEALRATPWSNAEQLARHSHPFIVVGSEEELFKWPATQAKAGDVVLRPYRASELLVRASRLVARKPPGVLDLAPKAPLERRVVIADDDPAITAIIKVLLKGYHCECHIARNGQEALESARSLAPDLLILDVNMPHLSGFEVLERLRENPTTSSIRVVLLTASDHDSDVARGASLGADDYIRKPFSMFELATRVKRLIRDSSASAPAAAR